jgi:hypothetical protein
MTDEQALTYANDYGIPLPEGDEIAHNEQDAIAQQLQGSGADAHGEEEEPPAKTPKKAAAGRKRKTIGTPAEEAEATKATPASPDKKRRRSTKAAEEKEEPKKAGRGKKAKGA